MHVFHHSVYCVGVSVTKFIHVTPSTLLSKYMNLTTSVSRICTCTEWYTCPWKKDDKKKKLCFLQSFLTQNVAASYWVTKIVRRQKVRSELKGAVCKLRYDDVMPLSQFRENTEQERLRLKDRSSIIGHALPWGRVVGWSHNTCRKKIRSWYQLYCSTA